MVKQLMFVFIFLVTYFDIQAMDRVDSRPEHIVQGFVVIPRRDEQVHAMDRVHSRSEPMAHGFVVIPRPGDRVHERSVTSHSTEHVLPAVPRPTEHSYRSADTARLNVPTITEQMNLMAFMCCVMPILAGTLVTVLPLRDIPLFEKNFFEYSQQDYEKILRASLFISCAFFHAKTTWAMRNCACCQFLLTLPLLGVYTIPMLVGLLPDNLSTDDWRTFCACSLVLLPYVLILNKVFERAANA